MELNVQKMAISARWGRSAGRSGRKASALGRSRIGICCCRSL